MVKGVCSLARCRRCGGGGDLRGGRGGAGDGVPRREDYQRERMCVCGECGVPVAESAVAPPGPIPNPVVTHGSAGEY
jgi:hypothetical protein